MLLLISSSANPSFGRFFCILSNTSLPESLEVINTWKENVFEKVEGITLQVSDFKLSTMCH